MINTYKEYLSEEYSLTVSQMERVHSDMTEEIGRDEDALEIYEDVVKACTRYASMRAEWLLMSMEQKMERDSFRTSCHDSVITNLNMLARYLRMQGKPAKWRDTLGYIEDDKKKRKAIGDFACYIVFVNSLNAR